MPEGSKDRAIKDPLDYGRAKRAALHDQRGQSEERALGLYQRKKGEFCKMRERISQRPLKDLFSEFRAGKR